jgi:serine/threonine protein kinase
MGAVYEAIHRDIGRRVAIKVLLECDEEALPRFRQEALVVAALVHPNVIEVSDLFADKEKGVPAAIVMSLFADGRSLAHILHDQPDHKIDRDRAIAITLQMLSGLAAAHDKGIIHRDIKPSNVLVMRPEHGPELVKLIDFGVAKWLDAGGLRTTTGLVLGTPAYMAPEQILAEEVNASADLYAVGACLYEMLTGEPPVGNVTGPQVARKVLELDAPRLVEEKIDSRPIADVIAKALAKKSEDRFLSASEMAAALSKVLSKPIELATTQMGPPPSQAKTKRAPVAAKKPSSSSSPMRLFLSAASVVVIAGGAVGAIYMVTHHRPQPTTPTPTAAVPVEATSAPPTIVPSVEASIAPPVLSGSSSSTTTTTTTPRSPRPHAIAGHHYAKCVCVQGDDELSWEQRKCYCIANTFSSGEFCAVLDSAGRCKSKQLPDPGAFAGPRKECLAFRIDDGGSATSVTGQIQCTANYDPRPANHGDACSGFLKGSEVQGRYRCAP